MDATLEKWISGQGIKFLEQIGLKEGDKVLDCCCGEGNFSIPAAKIVKKKGLIYAIDMNSQKLDILLGRSRGESLKNITIIELEFTNTIPLPGSAIDVVLLYDIYWYFSIGDTRLTILLSEVYRVLKSDALLSVYPEHVDSRMLKQKIEDSGFLAEKEFFTTIIHDNEPKKGRIMNFRKYCNNIT